MGAAAESSKMHGTVQVVEVVDVLDKRTQSTANYAPLVTKSPFLLFICSLAILSIAGLQVALNNSIPIDSHRPEVKVKRQKIQTIIENGETKFFMDLGDSTPSTSSDLNGEQTTIFNGVTSSSISPESRPSSAAAGGTSPNPGQPAPHSFITLISTSFAINAPLPSPNSDAVAHELDPTTGTSSDDQSASDTETIPTVGHPAPNSQITLTSVETIPTNAPGHPAPNSQITLTSAPSVLTTLTPGQTVTDSNGRPLPTLVYTDGRFTTSSDAAPIAAQTTALTLHSDGTPIATIITGMAISTAYVDGTPVATMVPGTALLTIHSDGTPVATITPPPTTMSKTNDNLLTFLSTSIGIDGMLSSFVVVAPRPTQTDMAPRPTQIDKTKGIFPALQNGPVRQLPFKFHGDHYFWAMYSGTFIAVLFKILWACVYGGNKMMEPFYQLNKTGGASAKESLMSDYLSSGISWWSLKVVFGGHWVMILTLAVAFLITLLPPLAAESMSVRALSMCRLSDGLDHPCNPVWTLNVNMIRFLQTVLSLITFCILIIVAVNLRRRSGINANPSSIATMATLLHHPDILSEVRNISSNHTQEELAAILSHSRYQITSYMDTNGQEHIGLARANVHFDQPEHKDQEHDQDQDQDQEQDQDHTQHPHPSQYVRLANPGASHAGPEHYSPPPNHTSTVLSSVLTLLVIGVFAVVVKYWFESGPTPFNNFFNSDHFGPRFILTSASSMIAVIWLDIEREVRIHTPYRALARRNADAKLTIIASVDGSSHQSLVGSLMRKHYFHFFVALATILADFLTIALAGVPYSSAQIRPSFVASTWTAVAILSFMLLVIICVVLWRWSNHKLGIPKRPNETLLKVWTMLANEGNVVRSMVEDGWSNAKQRDRDQHILTFDAKYWAGWITDEQGRRRWIVDGEGAPGVPEYQHTPRSRKKSEVN